MDIYYKNFYDEKVILNRWPCMLQNLEEFESYEWQSEIKETSNHKEKILELYMKLQKKKIELSIFADSKEEMQQTLNEMHRIFEGDIARKTPGRIFVGDEYIWCFCHSGRAEEYEEDFYTTDYEIGIITAKPFWIREKFLSYPIYSGDEGDVFFNFPFNFPFNFTSQQKGISTLENDHYADANFELVIYGPAVDPVINIGGYPYRVYTTVETNEYLVIDSQEKTVTRTLADGTIANEYDNRSFENSVFRPIPPGNHNVLWSGDFGWDITLYKERSKPEW